jgi:hypothetical protein
MVFTFLCLPHQGQWDTMCYTYLVTKNIGSIVPDSAWEIQYHVINLKQYSLPTPERGQLTFSMQSFVLLEKYYRYVLHYLYIGMWCLYENVTNTTKKMHQYYIV